MMMKEAPNAYESPSLMRVNNPMQKIFCLTLLLVLGSVNFSLAAQPSIPFAYFFDCLGYFIKVNLENHKTVAHGHLSDINGAGFLRYVRDGCLVHDADYDFNNGFLYIKAQLAPIGTDNIPTGVFQLELPKLDFIKKVDSMPENIGSEYKGNSSTEQIVLLDRIKRKPFDHQFVLFSPDGKFALFAEYKPLKRYKKKAINHLKGKQAIGSNSCSSISRMKSVPWGRLCL